MIFGPDFRLLLYPLFVAIPATLIVLGLIFAFTSKRFGKQIPRSHLMVAVAVHFILFVSVVVVGFWLQSFITTDPPISAIIGVLLLSLFASHVFVAKFVLRNSIGIAALLGICFSLAQSLIFCLFTWAAWALFAFLIR